MSAPLDQEARARLLSLKLRALVADGFGDRDLGNAQVVPLGAAAALMVDGDAFVLVDERPERGLGVALAWATKNSATNVHVLAERATSTLARRAAEFDLSISVWHVDGRTLIPAIAAPLAPEPNVPASHRVFASVIEAAGADVVTEHGVLCGEVRGLEVCRVVTDEHTGIDRLEVGVGAHDREAFGLMHGETPTAESLRRIVNVVRRHRAPGADPHPLNRLGAERALRARVIDDPSLIGLMRLVSSAPAEPRPNLKDPIPCVALGETAEGGRVVTVFSSGIDLDVVPFAADARLFHGSADPSLLESEVMIVVPERDLSPVTMRVASLLRHPARIVGVRPA